jgi:thermopsin
LEAAIQAAHVDPRKIYPPNLLYAPTIKNGMVVAPSYPEAPEPVGLADYGVMNSSGTPSSYTIDTSSYRASVYLHSVTPYYLANGVPEGFTSQLNVVLKNVTLHGNSSYNFWTQNVFFYDAYSDQLFVENNIWNFSAPSAPQPVSTFITNVSGFTNGSDDPSIGYYAAGTPTYTGITTPFTIIFYINATTRVLNGTAYTEADFAFDLLSSTGAMVLSDQYDRVLFNNSGGGPSIPQAMFHVDGTNITPTGFIPYDAEVMLGGPGGGSTATFQAINGTMTLQHWSAATHQYVNEPSAWSSGSETGETSVGVAEYYDSAHVVHLNGGPEFIQPFWNSSASAKAGAATLTGTIHPSNSWAFVSGGSSYNSSSSAWAPLPATGAYSWALTSGTYVVKLMASDFDAVTSTSITLGTNAPSYYNVSLVADTSQGVYAPLYAWSNAQLAAISSSGSGTLASPYILVNNEQSSLATEFGSFNDYAFPSYAGISLVGTSAYVEISNPAPFSVAYSGAYYTTATYFSLPSTNHLPIWLFDTSHVSILGGTVQGWFSANQNGFPFANLLIWNSTSTLVSGVTFDVSTNAIFTYGGSGNTFTGNTFENSVLSGNFMTPSGYFYLGPYGPFPTSLGITGIIENEGGDAVWNNYFATTVTAFESNANVYDDLYASYPETFANDWNLTDATPVAASTVFTVNGVSISGSVSGNSTVCGNWWWNYVNTSTLPYANPYPAEVPYYTGTGNIITGGDYCPSGPAMFPVPVSEVGLPNGTFWSVDILPAPSQTLPYGGGAYSFTGNVSYTLPAGDYTAEFSPVADYAVSPGNYSFTVTSSGKIFNGFADVASVTAVYTAMSGTLLFEESGLPTGTTWSVTLNGSPLSGENSTLWKDIAFGTYNYSVGSVPGFAASPANGTVMVLPSNVTAVNIVFNATNGSLRGTVEPTNASVWVDGSTVSVTAGAFAATLAAGVHSVVASASGYYSYYNNVTVVSGMSTNLTIVLNPVTPPVGPDGTLSVVVTPAFASLWVDGSKVTLSGGSYSSPATPGVHSLEATATGYYPYYNNATVSSHDTTTLTISLNLVPPVIGPDGTLTLSVTPTSASAWVDGAPVTLSSGAYSGSATPGVHSVEVAASNYYPYFNNFTVKSSATTSVIVALDPVTPPAGPSGTLSLTVTPSSAEVWVDGSPVSLTGGTYSASATPGVHSIEVTASDYYAYFNNVTVKSGGTSTLTVSLNAVTTTTTTTSSNNSGVGTTGWIVIAALAVLAVIFLITTMIYMSRSRGGSGGKGTKGPDSTDKATTSDASTSNQSSGGGSSN